MRVLILGSSGFLGSIIYEFLSEEYEVLGTYNTAQLAEQSSCRFDYDEPNSIKNLLLDFKPIVIVNCIALADVDLAERQHALAEKMNHEFASQLAIQADSQNIRLIHISTDHFESPVNGLLESATPKPVNVYGSTKLRGDIGVLTNSKRSIVLRTNFFGRSSSGDRGLIDSVAKSLSTGNKVEGYANISFNPVGAHFLAESISRILRTDFSGLLNVGSSRVLSKYEFLCILAEKLGYTAETIIASNFLENSSRAHRPRCMALDTGKFVKVVGGNFPSLELQLENELSCKIGPLDGKFK